MQKTPESKIIILIEKLSLSVEEGNPARKLYEKCGFADAGGNTDPGTMVLEL